ncbi:MAG: amidase [Anaerolineae bacterium]|nr:amidase [Anaerolineae bacterium]
MLTQKPTKTTAVLNALRQGDLDLLEYIDQLETHFNQREPDVLAFVPEENRFNRLRSQAETLLVKYPESDFRPPLFGLPVGVKDIFHVDGFTTRAGSQIPPHVIQGAQASSVTALLNAGALVLGKTITTEFAYFSPGPTRNPHNPSHTPGGSSSGSAAAVAAGLVPLALGTQTIGSVTRPASFCGVVGFKPSFDRIPKHGVIPLAPSLDHVGLFTSDIPTAFLAASLLCEDWKPAPLPDNSPVLGIPTGPYLQNASPQMLAHFDAVCSQLEKAGLTVKRVQAMPNFEAIVNRHGLIVAAEAFHTHAEWFSSHEDSYHPKTAELIRNGQAISPADLSTALEGRQHLRNHLTTLMDEHHIDLWLSPSAPHSAPAGLQSTGDPVMNLPWTHSGLPTLGLPSGQDEAGLPLGLQIAARWHQDEAVFDWANILSQVLE